MRQISVEPEPCGKRTVSRLKTLSHTSRNGLKKTEVHSFANSTLTRRQNKVQHEALFREPAPFGPECHRLRPRWPVPCPSRPCTIPPCGQALLSTSAGSSRAQAFGRVPDHQPPVLHRESHVEAELVSARLRLRHRTAE